jgi:hypothetical protein
MDKLNSVVRVMQTGPPEVWVDTAKADRFCAGIDTLRV